MTKLYDFFWWCMIVPMVLIMAGIVLVVVLVHSFFELLAHVLDVIIAPRNGATFCLSMLIVQDPWVLAALAICCCTWLVVGRVTKFRGR